MKDMKYFKFTQISEETGVSWLIEQPISGPSIPFILIDKLDDIVELSHSPGFYVGTASNEAVGNPDNYIFEITFEEYAEELKKHITNIINQRLDTIYKEEAEFRRDYFKKYDLTAAVAGSQKYDEAKALVEDSEAPAPLIRQEADIRKIDPISLATRIIQNYESFVNDDVKIAGIRGMIYDRLSSYSFDIQTPKESFEEFFSVEVLGQREEIYNSPFEPKMVDVVVGKYEMEIGKRFLFLE
jgi:hypothetical protein